MVESRVVSYSESKSLRQVSILASASFQTKHTVQKMDSFYLRAFSLNEAALENLQLEIRHALESTGAQCGYIGIDISYLNPNCRVLRCRASGFNNSSIELLSNIQPQQGVVMRIRAHERFYLGVLSPDIIDEQDYDPTNPNNSRHLGKICVELELYQDAIGFFNVAIENDPVAGAYSDRGYAWSLQGESDKAIEDFNKALHIDPKCVLALINRGNEYEILGMYERAAKDHSKAERLENPWE